MDILHIYKQEMKKARFVESRLQNFSNFFDGLYMEMDKNVGHGFSEILFIRSGLYVERNDYFVHHDISSHHNNVNFSGLRFGILLSGNVDIQISGASYMNVSPRTLWCGWINSDSCIFKQFAGEKIRSISIELPDNFIESWLGSACCQESSQLEAWIKFQNNQNRKEGWRVLPCNPGKMTDCMRIAEQILVSKGQTFADSLHYESLALDFLSSILTLNSSRTENCYPKRNRLVADRVDDAVDILRQEFIDPPSISALARRVGINECYLKKGFREKTGETIGGYIRYLRMKKAQELLESGKYSVLDTAIFVGYSNLGHFSMAFKKMYGYSPSTFLPRFSQM